MKLSFSGRQIPCQWPPENRRRRGSNSGTAWGPSDRRRPRTLTTSRRSWFIFIPELCRLETRWPPFRMPDAFPTHPARQSLTTMRTSSRSCGVIPSWLPLWPTRRFAASSRPATSTTIESPRREPSPADRRFARNSAENEPDSEPLGFCDFRKSLVGLVVACSTSSPTGGTFVGKCRAVLLVAMLENRFSRRTRFT